MHFSMRIHPTGKRSLHPCAFVVSLLPHIRKPAVSSIYHNTELILFLKKETRARCEKHRIKGADYYLKSTTRIWRRYRFPVSCIIVDDKLLPIGGRYATYESFFFLFAVRASYTIAIRVILKEIMVRRKFSTSIIHRFSVLFVFAAIVVDTRNKITRWEGLIRTEYIDRRTPWENALLGYRYLDIDLVSTSRDTLIQVSWCRFRISVSK